MYINYTNCLINSQFGEAVHLVRLETIGVDNKVANKGQQGQVCQKVD